MPLDQRVEPNGATDQPVQIGIARPAHVVAKPVEKPPHACNSMHRIALDDFEEEDRQFVDVNEPRTLQARNQVECLESHRRPLFGWSLRDRDARRPVPVGT